MGITVTGYAFIFGFDVVGMNVVGTVVVVRVGPLLGLIVGCKVGTRVGLEEGEVIGRFVGPKCQF